MRSAAAPYPTIIAVTAGANVAVGAGGGAAPIGRVKWR